MIELRWVITGETRVLQYRDQGPGYIGEHFVQNMWSDWQDVPEIEADIDECAHDYKYSDGYDAEGFSAHYRCTKCKAIK